MSVGPAEGDNGRILYDYARITLDSYDSLKSTIAAAENTRRQIGDFDHLITDLKDIMPEQADQIQVVRQSLVARYEGEKRSVSDARADVGIAIDGFCEAIDASSQQTARQPLSPPPAPPRQGDPQSTPDESTGPELTIMLADAHQSRNLQTGALSPGNHAPGATTHLQSGSQYEGSVSIGANLPAGYTIYIFFHSQVWAVLSPTGGGFTVGENKGFGAANDVDAVVCLAGASVGGLLPNDRDGQKGCLYNADIDIFWQQ